ncbi:MAG: Flp pilus assembly protein CpaB [Planctomycetales bacterium]|nr:Flp pilus assembly protein CpaB [Planctomycetales bacterium]NIM09146.1 Flp pilus assembly protein CpaB [Planctomycetales bacterium]NIN08613.1 Flp pilus assembly protein CpaB [Planctomycetales bacterium]NIN77739.1 Flp pilus assembly protein CpaB [Planctomycetales bacterium]NIO34911.1 Flp pilus assembly protein CpaB [Planctomycetales bacterium]
MRPKSLILLVLALGCGLVASIGISEIIDSQRAQQGVAVETEAILVAKVDIERSTILSADNLILEDWPKNKVPTGAIRDLADVDGRRPVIKITGGLPLLESMIGTGEAIRPASEIPKGYRVVAVRVTDESGANLIRPGDRVDLQLFARRNPALGVDKTGTWVFLQDVSVFAVNQDINSDADSEQALQARTVSLLVTPLQAAKVTLATRIGDIRLIMRGVQDDEGSEQTVANINDLLNTSEKFEDDGEPAGPAEQGTRVASHDSSMLDWLNQRSQPSSSSLGETFEMVVMRGTDITVQQFQRGAHLPTTITAGASRIIGPNGSVQDSQISDSADNADESGPASDSGGPAEVRVPIDD